MPLNQETIPNKPLSGIEVKGLILQDLEKLLDNDCMLTEYIAHGRISWKVRYSLCFDNPLLPASEMSYATRKPAHKEQDPVPGLDQFPLSESSPEMSFSAHEISREVDSPNAERLRTGIPVEVVGVDDDGRRTTKLVKYDTDETIPEKVETRDVTDEERAHHDIKPAVSDEVVAGILGISLPPDAPVAEPAPPSEPDPITPEMLGKAGEWTPPTLETLGIDKPLIVDDAELAQFAPQPPESEPDANAEPPEQTPNAEPPEAPEPKPRGGHQKKHKA
jgi:hypothetical protein